MSMPNRLKSSQPLSIGIENSSWNNIGDAFYANSAEAILKSIITSGVVACLESPHRRSFRSVSALRKASFMKLV